MLWLFYPVALMMLFFAHTVILSNHPIRSVLSLIGCFLCATILWLLLDAEFLALALIFVYIGAVMTLFLFMVMMLNIDHYAEQDKLSIIWIITIPFVTLILPMLSMLPYINPSLWQKIDFFAVLPSLGSRYNNVVSLGEVLYTKYVWPFEIVAMILLTAIMIAVGLVARPSKGSKKQVITDQLAVKKADRITLVPNRKTQP